MAIGKVIQEELKNKDNILKLRYTASRTMFIFVCLLFFVNLFLYGSGLSQGFFNVSVSILYVLLIISLMLYLYFFCIFKYKEKFKEKGIYILMGVLVVVGGILLLPLFIK